MGSLRTMRNMLQVKTSAVNDSHYTQRNQCKLIWDSAKTPIKKSAHSSQNLKAPAPLKHVAQGTTNIYNGSSSQRRRSLVAARISFFEEPKAPKPATRKNSSPKGKQSVQVKIGFDDHATTTFEYEREESALENYLAEHPHEREEAERQEQDVSAGNQAIEELLSDSPRAPEPEISVLKSNVVIGASDKLGSYTPKMQTQGFQFGQNSEPEPEVYERRSNVYEDDEEEEEDNIQVLPANDLELEGFSAGFSNTDIMF